MNAMTTNPVELTQHLRIFARLSDFPSEEAATLSLSKQQFEWLGSLMAYDPESGVYSRTLFHNLAAAEWARALRARRDLSFILIRVRSADALQGNDPDAVLAHLRGALSAVQGVLRSAGDVIGRLDTLEFAVLLPETGSEGVRDVVGRLMPALETPPPDTGDTTELRIAADICSVTLSRLSVGEKGWQGALDSARNLLLGNRNASDPQVMHLEIMAAHRRTVC